MLPLTTPATEHNTFFPPLNNILIFHPCSLLFPDLAVEFALVRHGQEESGVHASNLHLALANSTHLQDGCWTRKEGRVVAVLVVVVMEVEVTVVVIVVWIVTAVELQW